MSYSVINVTGREQLGPFVTKQEADNLAQVIQGRSAKSLDIHVVEVSGSYTEDSIARRYGLDD